jgi:ABC-type polysaccharide transport system permease subunit
MRAGKAEQPGRETHCRKREYALTRKNRWLYLMALTGILFVLLFKYERWRVCTRFVDYNAISGVFGFGSKFVGFHKFEFFFSSEDWLPVTFNTLYLNTLFISTGLLMQVAMAVLLNELAIKPFQKVSQSLMFLPNFLSWTVVSIFALAFLGTNDGILNKFIVLLGGDKVRFYQNAQVWPGILVFLRLWKAWATGRSSFWRPHRHRPETCTSRQDRRCFRWHANRRLTAADAQATVGHELNSRRHISTGDSS